MTYHGVLGVKFAVIFYVRGIPDIFFDCLGLDCDTRVYDINRESK